MRLNANIDPVTHPIEGYARAALERGVDGSFKCPLISHIEGNLWMGGCIGDAELPEDFVHVVSLYPWERYQLGPDTKYTEWKMYDSADEALDAVDERAEFVVQCCKEGKTLVHCQAGLNRSGLVAAVALIKMGHTPVEAISLLREKRSPVVLCNQSFENWVSGLAE